MGDTIKNLGRNVTYGLYIDDKKIGKDFKNITDFKYDEEEYEGEDEYLGRSNVSPWGVFKMATGTFNFEEDNAGQIDSIIAAQREAKRAGQKPKIKIVEFTENNDGTTSKVVFTDMNLKFGKSVPAKGDKVKRSCTFRAGDMRPGS